MDTPFGKIITDDHVPLGELWFYSRGTVYVDTPIGRIYRHPDFKIVNIGPSPSEHDWVPTAPPG